MLAVGFPSKTIVTGIQFEISGDDGRVKGLSKLKTRGSLLGSNPWSVSMQSHPKPQNLKTRGSFLGSNQWSVSMKQNSWSTNIPNRLLKRVYKLPCKCKCSQNSGMALNTDSVDSVLTLAWSFKNWQGSIGIAKLAVAGGLIIFMIGGFLPVVRLSRSMYWNQKSDSREEVSTYHEAIWSLEPLFLWTGVLFICRELDPIFPATEAGKIVKLLLKFVKSVSVALAFDFCLASLNLESKVNRKNDAVDTRNTGFSFGDKVLYTVLCVLAMLSLIELLGLSNSKLGMGRVIAIALLVLSVSEHFGKVRATSMVHGPRPHVENEEIKTESEGYGDSGTIARKTKLIRNSSFEFKI